MGVRSRGEENIPVPRMVLARFAVELNIVPVLGSCTFESSSSNLLSKEAGVEGDLSGPIAYNA